MLAAWSAALNAAIRSSIIQIRFVGNYKSVWVAEVGREYLSASAQSRLVCVSTATSKRRKVVFEMRANNCCALVGYNSRDGRPSVCRRVCFSFVYISCYVYRRIKVAFGVLSGRAYTQTHTRLGKFDRKSVVWNIFPGIAINQRKLVEP